MVKKQKSSASAATRKKHARKAGGPAEQQQLPLPKANLKDSNKKGKGAKKSSEPRVKQYIPPSKPAPVRPDPLDSLGIAKRIPAELLVVLRRLSKKDGVTKRKALEELLEGYVAKTGRAGGGDGGDGFVEATLEVALPVWLHHFPSVILNPSRRIRLLTAQIHALLLQCSLLKSQIVYFLKEVGEATQVETILGAWCLATKDVDRQVASTAQRSWSSAFSSPSSSESPDDTIPLDSPTLSSLLSFTKRALFDPASVHADVNPVQPAFTPTLPAHASPKNRAKLQQQQLLQSQSQSQMPRIRDEDEDAGGRRDAEEESEGDRNGRLRVGAMGVLRWIVELQLQVQASHGEEEGLEGLKDLLESPLLWTGIFHGPVPPFCDMHSPSGFLGDGQPAVRRAAWTLIKTLLKTQAERKGTVKAEAEAGGKVVEEMGIAILRSAWVEPDSGVRSAMWEPLLTFLTKHPGAWEVERRRSSSTADKALHDTKDDGSDSEESDEEDDEENPTTTLRQPNVRHASPPAHSPAFSELLLFLQLGCYGSPQEGYPTLVIILSTLPPSLLPPSPPHPNTDSDYDAGAWTDLLTSLWAALDGRALTSPASARGANVTAFLEAVLECLVLLARRAVSAAKKEETEADGGAEGTVVAGVAGVLGEQVERVWATVTRGEVGRGVKGDLVGKALARALAALETLDDRLFGAAWNPISSAVDSSFSTFTSPSSSDSKSKSKEGEIWIRDQSLLSSLSYASSSGSKANSLQTRAKVDELVQKVGMMLLAACGKWEERPEDALEASLRIASTLGVFRDELARDHAFVEALETFTTSALTFYTSLHPSLFITYLSFRASDGSQDGPAAAQKLWDHILDAIIAGGPGKDKLLRDMVDAVSRGEVGARGTLMVDKVVLDEVAAEMVGRLVSGDWEAGDVLAKMITHADLFISLDAPLEITCTLLSELVAHSRVLRHRQTSYEADAGALSLLEPLLQTLSQISKACLSLVTEERCMGLIPELFLLGNILPLSSALPTQARALTAIASEIWSRVSASLNPAERSSVQKRVRQTLRKCIEDVDSVVGPSEVIIAVQNGSINSSNDALHDLFPTRTDLDALLSSLPSNPISPILSIIDPLIPPPSTWPDEADKADASLGAEMFDQQGLSKYARILKTMLFVAAENRDFVRSEIWALRHFLVLSIAASDRALVPSAQYAFFEASVGKEGLEEILQRARTLVTMAFLDAGEGTWHEQVIHASTVRLGKGPLNEVKTLLDFVSDTLSVCAGSDDLMSARVAHIIMQHLLNSTNSADAAKWLTFARRLEKTSPNTSNAVLRAINESGLEPQGLDRYRNELAAGILGVRPLKANTDGLSFLYRLALVAPDPDSVVAFIPQNRALNLLKHCQGWIASDDEDIEIDGDVESELTLVVQHLAPILQGVVGAHWEFVFDVIESNLEEGDFKEDESLPVLARTFRLITMIQDLAITNKTLRADWAEREKGILTLVRDLVQSSSALHVSSSVPRSVCWELAFTIVQNLPSSLLDECTLAKMAHLLLDTSPEVQKLAYPMLQNAAQKRTEYLVIEAGVDTSENTKFELPIELLQLVQNSIEDEEADQNLFGYLLGWMLIFDLFDGASLRVKMGYAAQLRDAELITGNFVPTILRILNVSGSGTRPFALDPWSVEEYHVQYYDPGDDLSPKLFAAHLFYRALLHVPSLIAVWWGACKDRQLLGSMASLTTKHYSPVLIASELGHIKDPVGSAELSGENWTIKVSQGTGEVMASYEVDDQSMEIAVRLPPDYPLHGVEVREVQKLGVEEKRWRGWLLAVQQIVTSQNGRIVDGLSMFKKNVTHHFENQTECAICYSIISVTELSLPKKRCKTCKNKFHSGCLFKWFSTSHTSSCPLCRSDFI